MRITAQDADALGSRRRGRVREAPRLDRGGRASRARWSTRSSAPRASSTPTGSTTSCSAGWAARRSRPRSSPAPTASTLTVLDSTDPGQVLAALRRPPRDRPPSWSRRSRARRSRPTARSACLRAGVPRRRHRPDRAHRRRDRPRLAARRVGARRRLPRVQRRPERRRPLLGADRLRPRAVRLAGVDIAELLDEAEAIDARARRRRPRTRPGARRGDRRDPPLRDKLGSSPTARTSSGFGDWAEQLIAESTGKQGTGLLPVVLDTDAPELDARPARPPGRPSRRRRRRPDLRATTTPGDPGRRGTLGAQLLVWEYATAVAGRLLGINPFDQPDVESAKIAARGLLDARPEPEPAAFVDGRHRGARHARGHRRVERPRGRRRRAARGAARRRLLSVQAYVDRLAHPELPRSATARRALGRPVTFGWGPRFLHSTGQFHKGGPADRRVPADHSSAGRRTSRSRSGRSPSASSSQAQAAGDASVLADHGRPVLTLTLDRPAANVAALLDAVG